MDILHAIGHTSLVQLQRLVPPGCADVLVKLEWENPTGSVKDRMALAVISRAEADGRLRPGDTVVDWSTPVAQGRMEQAAAEITAVIPQWDRRERGS